MQSSIAETAKSGGLKSSLAPSGVDGDLPAASMAAESASAVGGAGGTTLGHGCAGGGVSHIKLVNTDSDAKWRTWKAEKRAAHIAYDNESWYEALREHTFASKFMALSEDEADAIVAFYAATYLSRRSATTAEVETLRRLERRLEASIADVEVARGAGAFVRLSSRSPKDAAVLDRTVFLESLRIHGGDAAAAAARARLDASDGAEAVGDDGVDDAASNAMMLAYSEAAWRGLQVFSGRQALQMLLSSERAYTDLLEALAARERVPFAMKVVARAWEPQLRQDLEFRGFVCENRLRAISQYNHYVCHEYLLPHKDVLQAAMVDFWEKNMREQPALAELANYVVDFAVVPQISDAGDARAATLSPELGTGCRVVVVELNPFDRETGAGLFDWRADAELLTGAARGDARPEFRMHASPPRDLSAFVAHCVNEGFKLSAELPSVWPPLSSEATGASRCVVS